MHVHVCEVKIKLIHFFYATKFMFLASTIRNSYSYAIPISCQLNFLILYAH